jgi:hypothetical protein
MPSFNTAPLAVRPAIRWGLFQPHDNACQRDPNRCDLKLGDADVNRALRRVNLGAPQADLRWSAEDLARESTLGVTTIRRAELTDGETSMTAANDLAVRRALEAAGVEFIDENGGGPGVRLRKRQRAKASKT